MQETQVQSLGQGGSPGEGNGNPPQYSCLENPMDGEAWWALVHGVAKSQMTEWLTFTFFHLVVLFLVFWRPSIWLSIVSIPTYIGIEYIGINKLYIPTYIFTNIVREFPFSPTPSLVFIFRSSIIPILTGLRWYLIVVLLSTSLIIADVEHLFMCLLAISIELHGSPL